MVQKEIKLGKYRHFKNIICCVIGIAKHSETKEELVIYIHDGELWARPKKMFLENVERDNYNGPRFKYIGKE